MPLPGEVWIADIILYIQGKVRKETEIIPQLFEALRRVRPGKQLLPDGPEQLHGIRLHQTRHLLSHRTGRNPGSSEEFGPGAGINDDLHNRFWRILL
jgi:hypothetical protein